MRTADPYTRREFLGVASAGVGALLAACRGNEPRSQNIADMTLTARPGTPTKPATIGLTMLGLDPQTDGRLFVPAGYNAANPTPLLVLLHAAGRSSIDWFTDPMKAVYDELGVIVLAPDSRGFSWDMPLDGLYGPDTVFINSALAEAFSRCNVDATRIGIGGFSDGASEALGLGIANGDFISKVVAFSPGRLFGPFRRGTPSFFVSHGTDDDVVPVQRTRDALVPTLQGVFTDVTFVEFQGVHEVPDAIHRQGLEWFSEP